MPKTSCLRKDDDGYLPQPSREPWHEPTTDHRRRAGVVVGLLLVILPLVPMSASGAGTAGRFAFRKLPAVPGFRIDSNGFRAAGATADTLRFAQPAKKWQAAGVSWLGATYVLGGSGRAPDKLRVNLLSPGFELHFVGGFGFSAGSNLSPYISWSEGSIGPGVPTPKSSWFLISFQQGQPPIMLSLPGSTAAIKLSGKPGQWRIDSVGVYQGWVRVALPVGVKSILTTNAAELGQMVANFKRHAAFWTAPTPVLEGQDARIDKESVVVTWRFNRPFAVVPYPVLRAGRLGYRIAPLTKVVATGVDNDEGPIGYSAEGKIAIRFPRAAIPPGRAVVAGAPIQLAPGSPLEVPALVRMAFTVRLANSSPVVTSQASGLTDDFVSLVPTNRDSVSGLSFPFESSGRGMDVAGAHALLSAAVGRTDSPMLDALRSATDWLTWRTWPALTSAGALGSLAGWFSDVPSQAGWGAMMEAGLVTEKVTGPLDSIRKSAYSRRPEGLPEDRWVAALRSPLRTLGEEPLMATTVSGGYRLGGAGGSVVLAQQGMAVGSELLKLADGPPGWSRYAMPPSGSALLPPLATPLVSGLAGVEWK